MMVELDNPGGDETPHMPKTQAGEVESTQSRTDRSRGQMDSLMVLNTSKMVALDGDGTGTKPDARDARHEVATKLGPHLYRT